LEFPFDAPERGAGNLPNPQPTQSPVPHNFSGRVTLHPRPLPGRGWAWDGDASPGSPPPSSLSVTYGGVAQAPSARRDGVGRSSTTTGCSYIRPRVLSSQSQCRPSFLSETPAGRRGGRGRAVQRLGLPPTVHAAVAGNAGVLHSDVTSTKAALVKVGSVPSTNLVPGRVMFLPSSP
jgi:hypothetical protein